MQAKTILVAVLAVLSVVLVGVSAYQRQNQSTEPMPIVINQPVASQPVVTTPDETAGWQTYKNEQYGLEIKYPPGALLVEGRTHERPDSGVISISGYAPTTDNSPKSDSWLFDIDVKEISPNVSLEQWWGDTFQCDPKEDCFDASFTKYDKSELGGYPAFKSVLLYGGGGEPNGSRTGYYILKDNRIYIIVANLFYEQARTIKRTDQMLSTFKFIK